MNAEETHPQEVDWKHWVELLTEVTSRVAAVTMAIGSLAPTVLDFTREFAQRLDTLGASAQRTGISVEVLQQIGYAVQQAGGGRDEAQTSLENMARFINTAPDAESVLTGMGVAVRDANGEPRDIGGIVTDVGQQLGDMPYAQANQYAQTLGIDEKTLAAMRQGLMQYRDEYAATVQAIGFNTELAVAASSRFTTALGSFEMLTDLIQQKAGAALANGLSDRLNQFRALIVDNFPLIDKVINGVVTAIIWVADVTLKVAQQLLQAGQAIEKWWSSLDAASQQVIGILGGVGAAVAALAGIFAMSPIGGVIALATALVALIEDYNIWRAGGDSLIDWSAWAPGIEYATAAIGSLGGDFAELFQHVAALGSTLWEAISAFLAFINIDTSQFSGKWLFDQIIESVHSAIKMVSALVDALQKLVSGDFSGAFGALQDAASALVEAPIVKGINYVVSSAVNKVGNTIGEYFTDGKWGASHRAPQDPLLRPAGQILRYDGRFNDMLTPYQLGISNVHQYGMALLPPQTPSVAPPQPALSVPPSLQQSTTINYYGSNDAQSAANIIVSQQEGVNSRIVQQLTRGNR